MKNFTESFAERRLSKEVMKFIRELDQPHREQNTKDVSKHLERLYHKGIFTKQDYLFCSARVLLNDFCYKVENHIGRGCVTGFLFYCQDRNLLCFGAGPHYPQPLKDYCVMRPPSLDLESTKHYPEEIFILEDIKDWPDTDDEHNWVPVFESTPVKSMMSKRMRLNGFTFGTFELYFPVYGGPTEQEILFVREQLQPLKEQLYAIREEMIEAVEHTIDLLGHENYTKTCILNGPLRHLGLAICGLPIFEGMFPLAGQLINMA